MDLPPSTESSQPAFEVALIKPNVSIDLLNQLDIRVGRIDRVEDVKGSNKLVKLTVDFGDRTRTILVGMKQEREEPKEIEGRQALFVVNLEPRKIMGEISEGMLLDIGYADGLKPVLAVPEDLVPNGARAG
jgi:tRNA-binding protein